MTRLRPIYLALVLILTTLTAHAEKDSTAMHLTVGDVVVTAHRQIVSTIDNTGNVSINMDALSDMPRLGGAVDVIKLLQYTPGVAATQEGNTSLYVRGGDAGQSIILLDGAPLYTPSHLLGFFSVLNTPHLSGLTLYKSGIPARYGSSTASVTDVRTHSRIADSFHIEGNIGLIESDAAIQLPIGERFALYATARHSYVSWLSQLITANLAVDYDFGDYGLGFVADVGKAGKLSFNTHLNSDKARADVFIFNSGCDLDWWNALGTLRLDTPINDHVRMSNTLYSSIYDNKLHPVIAANSYNVQAGLSDIGFKTSTTIDLRRLTIDLGGDYDFRRISPQRINLGDHLANDGAIIEDSSEVAIYTSVHYPITQHLTLDAGLRLSLFHHDHTWVNPEPRIALEIPIRSNIKMWASYNMLTQYIHLAPQSNMSFATDFYITSSEHTPPQHSHNLSIGYGHDVLSGRLRWSAELYYRYMYNVVEYDSRVLDVLINSGDHYAMLHTGRGESYGVETSIAYNDTKFDVQLNYTLSRSLRQFTTINDGNPFPAHSDRRHNLTLLASYKPTPRWTLSAMFAYATGMPYTETVALYIGGNAFLREFGPYNGGKLPGLNHLDLSVTYWFKSKRLERSGINISVYNVYARRNPLMVSWDVQYKEETGITIKERRHVIYTIMPSISWTYKF